MKTSLSRVKVGDTAMPSRPASPCWATLETDAGDGADPGDAGRPDVEATDLEAVACRDEHAAVGQAGEAPRDVDAGGQGRGDAH